VLKDLAPEVSVGTVDEAAATLSNVIKTCNTLLGPLKQLTESDLATFNQVVLLLASELASPNATVRKHVLMCLNKLSELTQTEVRKTKGRKSVILIPFSKMTDLLQPSKTTILRPIFSKQLRTLPLLTQMGYVEALTVCLNLKPPLLSFSNELVAVIQEAHLIAESDDIAGLSKPPTHKTMQIYSSLRTVFSFTTFLTDY